MQRDWSNSEDEDEGDDSYLPDSLDIANWKMMMMMNNH